MKLNGGEKASRVCPNCHSNKNWKDGIRRNKSGPIQRYTCKDCSYRFSESIILINRNNDNGERQVCVTKTDAKNLTAVEPLKSGLAGATTDLKSLTFNFMWYLKKQGRAESTIKTYVAILNVLSKRGANLNDPENVKMVIASQENWSNARKQNVVKAYTIFLKMENKTWDKPRYRAINKDPFIPMEEEIDQLIAGCSKQMATFLQVPKETGARRGEGFNLTWDDIDLARRTIRISPEKGSNPRTFRMSEKLVKMLNNLTHSNNKVWGYKNTYYLERGFRRQRNKIASKIGNPRIKRIHMHTLRHWKATMLCEELNGNAWKVMKALGHKSVKTTERCIHLWETYFPDETRRYDCEMAKNTEEAKKLIEAGYEYVTGKYSNGGKLFKKRKLSFLGTIAP